MSIEILNYLCGLGVGLVCGFSWGWIIFGGKK